MYLTRQLHRCDKCRCEILYSPSDENRDMIHILADDPRHTEPVSPRCFRILLGRTAGSSVTSHSKLSDPSTRQQAI